MAWLSYWEQAWWSLAVRTAGQPDSHSGELRFYCLTEKGGEQLRLQKSTLGIHVHRTTGMSPPVPTRGKRNFIRINFFDLNSKA